MNEHDLIRFDVGRERACPMSEDWHHCAGCGRFVRTGSLRRLKTIPVRETRKAAQADLDAYAAAKRLPAYEVDNP